MTSGLATATLVRIGELTNRTYVLPLLVFFPTSRCNSRCVSCDWWKSSGADDLSLAEIGVLAASLPPLGARLVVFSGGEPLLRPDVFEAARLFRAHGLLLHLLTSAVQLEKCAAEVAAEFSRVIVSLDASTETLYHDIRGVNALGLVEKGVGRLRRIAPAIPVTARATLHRMNFRELPRLIDHAKAMAFGHPTGTLSWKHRRVLKPGTPAKQYCLAMLRKSLRVAAPIIIFYMTGAGSFKSYSLKKLKLTHIVCTGL